MMTSPIGTSSQQYRNTLGSPNVLTLRPTSPTPSLSHSSITLTLSLYSLQLFPFLPTLKFLSLTKSKIIYLSICITHFAHYIHFVNLHIHSFIIIHLFIINFIFYFSSFFFFSCVCFFSVFFPTM